MTLQTRRLGRTGHHSTLAMLGSAAFANAPQASVDAAMQFVLAAPEGYELPAGDVERIVAQVPNMSIRITRDPKEGARGAHVLYTDTWVSMGQETEKARRMKAFEGYQVNDELLERAADSAVVLHCLPAYRGLEVSAEVMEGPRSLVFPQAENRLHFQKGLLACLMGNK